MIRDETAADFLSSSETVYLPRESQNCEELPPKIRGYCFRKRIGKGGMGSVWMAEEARTIRRQVAIKVIKNGRTNNSRVVARFEAERQAVAIMQHPNIVSFFTAGATDDHRPYFTMELVNGSPITTLCNKHRLSVNERLVLMGQVCLAIQHSHQKGVIHRDIKPSNVLVMQCDGQLIPKVIDFGLARIREPHKNFIADDHASEAGQLRGSPRYMSPEQTEMKPESVDARSDVYSLGVLLYELLTGTTPICRDALGELSEQTLAQFLNLVRRYEPHPPSIRLSQLGDKIDEIAQQRSILPYQLGQKLRPELDWIVMKAIDKDPARRYETAIELAADIEQLVDNDLEQPRPQTNIRRVHGFLKSQRTAITMSLLIASIVGFILRLSYDSYPDWKSARATNFRQARLHDVRGYETPHRLPAESVLREISGVANSFESALAVQLVNASTRLEYVSSSDPSKVVGLQEKLGRSLQNLGFAEPSSELRQSSLASPKYSFHTSAELADDYRRQGRSINALPLLHDSFSRMRSTMGEDHPQTLRIMSNLAQCELESGRTRQATELFQSRLRICRDKLGPNHPDTIFTMDGVATAHVVSGRYAEAAAMYQKSLTKRERILGKEHPATIQSMNRLAAADLLKETQEILHQHK